MMLTLQVPFAKNAIRLSLVGKGGQDGNQGYQKHKDAHAVGYWATRSLSSHDPIA